MLHPVAPLFFPPSPLHHSQPAPQGHAPGYGRVAAEPPGRWGVLGMGVLMLVGSGGCLRSNPAYENSGSATEGTGTDSGSGTDGKTQGSGLPCAPGLRDCGGENCVDIDSDVNHCGGCDQQCLLIEECKDGICCRPEFTLCDGVCVDLATNLQHCGECGRVCEATHEFCDFHTCWCRNGLTLCDGECVDPRTDVRHCGGCNRPCDYCGGGRCLDQATCMMEYPAVCGHACTDLRSDPLNCGLCGEACQFDELCFSGRCAPYVLKPECASCPCSACENTTCCESDFAGGVVCAQTTFCE